MKPINRPSGNIRCQMSQKNEYNTDTTRQIDPKFPIFIDFIQTGIKYDHEKYKKNNPRCDRKITDMIIHAPCLIENTDIVYDPSNIVLFLGI